MRDSRDTTVRVDLQEPRRLHLIVYFAYISIGNGQPGHFVAIGKLARRFEFFEEDGDGVSVGRWSCVEVDGHCCC